MTQSRGFCPRCGEKTDPDVGADRPTRERGLCRACYLEEQDLLEIPELISIELCTGCGSYRVSGEWIDTSDGMPEIALEIVADRIGIHRAVDDFDWYAEPSMIDTTTVAVECEFDILVEGGYEHRTHRITVRFEPTTCTRCSRIAGKSYASTVQIRATERTPSEDELDRARSITAAILNERVDLGDRDAFLTDVIERPEGLDLRLSTTRLGSKVASAIHADLGGSLDTTSTLVTTDSDGQDVYRTTHAIRLPYARVDDIITVEGDVYLVESVNRRIGVRHLTTGERQYFDTSDIVDAVVAHRDDAEQATIVDVTDQHAVQVIDPTTYEAVTVARYDGVDVGGESVEAIHLGGTLYLLPSDE